MNPGKLLRHELIGLKAEVIESKNKSLLGLSGRIVNETKKTFTIESARGLKRFMKSVVKLKISLGKKTAIVDGRMLVARPEDRLKKRFRI